MEHYSKKPFFSSFSPFLFLLVLLPSLVLVFLVCKIDLEIPWRIGLDKDFSSLQNSQLHSFSNNISSPKLLDPAALDLKEQSFSPPIVSKISSFSHLDSLFCPHPSFQYVGWEIRTFNLKIDNTTLFLFCSITFLYLNVAYKTI